MVGMIHDDEANGDLGGEIGASYDCYCDDGGCSALEILEVDVWVVGVQGSNLTGPPGSFAFALEPGVYTIKTRASDFEYINADAELTVTVIAEDSSDSGGSDGSSEGGGSGLGAEGSEGESGAGPGSDEGRASAGCNCSTRADTPLGAAGLALLGMLGLRRSRRIARPG
ncbi:MYXO-CTERM sorting domain-containing protein [Nannocystaceae bacterium ST9]